MTCHDNNSHIVIEGKKIYKNKRSNSGYIALQHSQFNDILPHKALLIIKKSDEEITKTFVNISNTKYTQFITIPANIMLVLQKIFNKDSILGDLIVNKNCCETVLEFIIKEKEEEGDAP